LVEIFAETPEWDVEGKYNADSVNVYFESINDSKTATKVTKIDTKTCTLFKALTVLR